MRIVKSDWRDLRLTENFKAGEFIVSDSQPNLAAAIFPAYYHIDNFHRLAEGALQPMRDEWGPVRITSGLTSERLDKALGRKPGGQHFYGEAVDCIPLKADAGQVFDWLMFEHGWAGELIFYPNRGHIHVGLPSFWVHEDQFVQGGN